MVTCCVTGYVPAGGENVGVAKAAWLRTYVPALRSLAVQPGLKPLTIKVWDWPTRIVPPEAATAAVSVGSLRLVV
jgi:hypothetical protein